MRSGDLTAAAKTERTNQQTLPARRGAIYDRNGVALAQSIDKTRITCDPTIVQQSQVNEIARYIYQNLGLGGTMEDYRAMLTKPGARGVTIAEAADNEAAAKLEEKGYPGLYFSTVYKRVYPLKEICCNIVGCLHDDGDPAGGLESQYDGLLTGTDGSVLQERGISGGVIVGGDYEYTEPIPGKDVRISIDVDIQRVVQDTLNSTVADWQSGDASCVVMKADTGEILACASTPVFDPNDLSTLWDSGDLNCKAITSAYEPGSVIKPITMSMGVDLGIITGSSSYWAPVEIQVGDDWVSDPDNRTYETDMTTTNMLERSSNVGTVLVAQDIGAKNYSDYLEKYEIGHKTGIDYPYENVPHVKTYDEFDGAWEAMAFGQAIMLSPLEMTRSIGVLANKGVLEGPHFLLSVDGEDVEYQPGKRVISEAAATELDWMMNSVVVNGYAYTGAIEGYNVSAKTGTAERYDPDTGTYSNDRFMVSFIGFAPTEDPQVVVYVLVDDVDYAHEGLTVGGAWSTIMKSALTKLGVPPSS